MKILIIVDKQGTAIDRLAKAVQRNLPQHQIIVYPLHPKRYSIEEMVEVQKLMMWCDLIDVHYWKSGIVMRQTFPTEFNAKPRILFHFNPYDAQSEENQYYDKVVVGNKEIHDMVPSAHLIPYMIDLSFFKYKEEYTEYPTVMMSVNRIEGKKGVKEVAQACRELDYKFILVGRVSKPEYMKEVIKAANPDGKNDKFEFIENATDEQLRDVYYRSAIHVCNSIDKYESGTLPILEAMACGVPVLTRMIGHVPELFNGANLDVRVGAQDDLEDLKVHLKNLMDSRQLRENMREKAWDTVKTRDDRRMAAMVNKLYWQLKDPAKPLVSVIIPTKDNPKSFLECLVAAVAQDWDKLEVVVADSGEVPVKQIINEVKKNSEVPIKYIHFDRQGRYSLGEARNRAIIEADGEVLVFCDERMKMNLDAVTLFASYHKPKTWVWGVKDNFEKGFVENFSSIGRLDLIRNGMFNERIQWYGGMTQELRERFEGNGFDFLYIPQAKATSIKRTSSKSSRRLDIIEAKNLIFKMYHK